MNSEKLRGDPIAPGFAMGRLCVLGRISGNTPIFRRSIEDPSGEADRFRRHVDSLEDEIEEAVERLESESFLGEAEILRTHLMMLKDPDLHDQVLGLIHDTRLRAEIAVEQVLEAE